MHRANKKDNPRGVVTVCVLFDDTNGIEEKKRSRIRDQERARVASDQKRVMREKAKHGERTFATIIDVSEAHRQIPIDPRNWHCQVHPRGPVFINGSRDLWRRFSVLLLVESRVCPRETIPVFFRHARHDVVPICSRRISSRAKQTRVSLCTECFLRPLCTTLVIWFRGSVFELIRSSYKLGISQRSEIAQARTVNITPFEEGLGRVMYVASALEHERPFQSPLYTFMSLHTRCSVRTVPPYVRFFPSYLSQQAHLCRHHACAIDMRTWDSAPRVDAQASEGRTRIGVLGSPCGRAWPARHISLPLVQPRNH